MPGKGGGGAQAEGTSYSSRNARQTGMCLWLSIEENYETIA